MDKSKTDAATKIQKIFRRRLLLKTLKKTPDVCLTEPIIMGNENISMFLKKGRKEIPLFNIFNFSPNEHGIKHSDFFSDFHEIISRRDYVFGLSDFYVHKPNADEIEISIKMTFSIFTKKAGFDMNEHLPLLNEHVFPYILFIFANNTVDLDEMNEDGERKIYNIEIQNPTSHGENASGAHKDDTVCTCLTYVDSPVSTELAFDIEGLDLEWLTCSPIFRFDTSDKLYTLCFNDRLMVHTVPIFEEEGKDVSELQFFVEGHTVSEENGIIKHGDPNNPEYVFIKPKNRKKIARPEVRKVMGCFIKNDSAVPDDAFTVRFPISKLLDYKMSYEKEKLPLSEKQDDEIIENAMLGTVKMVGGKSKKKIKKKARKKTLRKRK